MTAKEKAKQMISKYFIFHKLTYNECIKAALITVDEILRLPSADDGRMMTVIEEDYKYWQEVKAEIEKL